MQEGGLPFEDELEEEEEDYYASLPFAALFSCFKVCLFVFTGLYMFLLYENVYICTFHISVEKVLMFLFYFLLQLSFFTLEYCFSLWWGLIQLKLNI